MPALLGSLLVCLVLLAYGTLDGDAFAVLVGATFPPLVPWGAGDATGWTLFVYSWLVLCVPMAFLVRKLELTRWGRRLAPIGLYLVGFGPLMCAITVDAYIKEFRGAAMTWDKTEKTGRVMA